MSQKTNNSGYKSQLERRRISTEQRFGMIYWTLGCARVDRGYVTYTCMYTYSQRVLQYIYIYSPTGDDHSHPQFISIFALGHHRWNNEIVFADICPRWSMVKFYRFSKSLADFDPGDCVRGQVPTGVRKIFHVSPTSSCPNWNLTCP